MPRSSPRKTVPTNNQDSKKSITILSRGRKKVIFNESRSPLKPESPSSIKSEPEDDIPFIDVEKLPKHPQQSKESPNIKTVTPSKSNQPDKCKYCEEKFKTRNDLWMHICKYLQCDSLNFICRICLKHIPKKDFDSHDHEVFTCLQCGKAFISKKSLNLHSKTHEANAGSNDVNEMIEEEEIPKEILNPRNQLLRRNGIITKKKKVRTSPRQQQHKRKKLKLECDICGKYLARHKNLEYHMNLHRSEPSFICGNCGESFFTPNGLRYHNCVKKRKRPEMDYRMFDARHCRFCDRKFASCDENKEHSCEYAHVDDVKLVHCRVCMKIVKKSIFNGHMETHSEIPWVCKICDKVVATSRALKLHTMIHSTEKPLKCTDCDETFMSKVVLDHHMRFHGKGPKFMQCETCFKEFSTKITLKSHIEKVHLDISKCEVCKEMFSSREILKEHIQLSHAPSICLVCERSFALPRYLKMHMKLHSSNDDGSRINCQFCSKSQLLKNLKNHVYKAHPTLFQLWMSENPDY